jgi:hypothetical protein
MLFNFVSVKTILLFKSNSMKKIKFEFRHYSDGQMLVFSKGVHVALTGNAFFPTVSPSLATLQSAITAYDAALSLAKEGGRANVAAKNARKQELVDILVDLALDLMKTAAGNQEMLETTGYPLSKTPAPQPPIGVPVITRIENGESIGELIIKVKRQTGVKTYVYEYSPDPLSADPQWTSHNTTSIKGILSGLVSGKKYWCRVVAFGSGDQVMVSDPALSRIVQ